MKLFDKSKLISKYFRDLSDEQIIELINFSLTDDCWWIGKSSFDPTKDFMCIAQIAVEYYDGNFHQTKWRGGADWFGDIPVYTQSNYGPDYDRLKKFLNENTNSLNVYDAITSTTISQ